MVSVDEEESDFNQQNSCYEPTSSTRKCFSSPKSNGENWSGFCAKTPKRVLIGLSRSTVNGFVREISILMLTK